MTFEWDAVCETVRKKNVMEIQRRSPGTLEVKHVFI